MTTRAFLSYSISKSRDQAISKALAGIIQDCVEALDWLLLDPMVRLETDSIREKVISDLNQSDLLIADVSTCPPNVMFEIGYATAIGIPIVYIVDEGTEGEQIHCELKHYLAFIDKGKAEDLPADLGDFEVLKYPATIRGLKDPAFTSTLIRLLQHLKESTLSQAKVDVRRKNRSIGASVIASMPKTKDHPFLYFLSDWCGYVERDLTDGGPAKFRLDAYYYSSTLPAFSKWTKNGAMGIADLTDSTERFWLAKPNPDHTRIDERIFLINRTDFFDKEIFSEYLEVVKHQSKKYNVRICDAQSFDKLNMSIFGKETDGRNLLLMSPDLVGAYVQNGRKSVQFVSDADLYTKGVAAYTDVEQRAIVVTPETKPNSLRADWMARQDIGRWNPDWNQIGQRDRSYYDLYEVNIRSWIPAFEELTERCADQIKSAVLDLLRRNPRQLHILEVGAGTGELTQQILAWLHMLNAPYVAQDKRPVIREFRAIDIAKRMKESLEALLVETRKSLGVAKLAVDFRTMKQDFLELLGRERKPNSKQYDIIFGSLVLHDLLEDATSNDIIQFLKRCNAMLKNGGQVIFADVFMDPTPELREVGLAEWKEHMFITGIPSDAINTFFENNPEMIDTVSIQTLNKLADSCGFESANYLPCLPEKTPLPFGVIVMQKAGTPVGRNTRQSTQEST